MNYTLYPNESTKSAPDLENIVYIGSSNNSLLLRASISNNFGGGRFGWVWICSAVLVFTVLLFLSVPNQANVFHDYGWLESLIIFMFVATPLYPTLYIWRRELPVCFNRNTRKISYWTKGRLVDAKWDDIKAYGDSRQEVFKIALYSNTPHSVTKHTIGISTEKSSARRFWEYIRVFMNEGRDTLPPISDDGHVYLKRVCSPIKIWNMYKPFPNKKNGLTMTIFKLLFLPLSVHLALICMLTELVYCLFDIILPKRRIPIPLQQAIEA